MFGRALGTESSLSPQGVLGFLWDVGVTESVLLCGPAWLCSCPPTVLQRGAQAEGLRQGSWYKLLSYSSSFTPGKACMVTNGATLGGIGVITN